MQLDIGIRLVIYGSVVGVIFETVVGQRLHVVLPLEDDIDEKIKLQHVCYLWNNVSTTC
jgi:hypothetical protein